MNYRNEKKDYAAMRPITYYLESWRQEIAGVESCGFSYRGTSVGGFAWTGFSPAFLRVRGKVFVAASLVAKLCGQDVGNCGSFGRCGRLKFGPGARKEYWALNLEILADLEQAVGTLAAWRKNVREARIGAEKKAFLEMMLGLL